MTKKKKRSGAPQKRTSKSAAAAGGKKASSAAATAGKKGGFVGALRAAASKIGKALGRKTSEKESASTDKDARGKSDDGRKAPASSAASGRLARPSGRTEPYIPKQQSMHSSPMGSGKGRDRDEEAIAADTDINEEFNDEDRLTNKSGDPRIGTHGRKYDS